MATEVIADNRRKLSAEAESQTERLIRIAVAVLDRYGVEMSHNRMVKLVRRYERFAGPNGWTFFDYFTNAIRMDQDRRREIANDPDVRRLISYTDRTGEKAVTNVLKQRGY
jgi:hypothetical protein